MPYIFKNEFQKVSTIINFNKRIFLKNYNLISPIKSNLDSINLLKNYRNSIQSNFVFFLKLS